MVRTKHRAEVPLIQGENIEALEAMRKHSDGGIGQSQLQVAAATNDGAGSRDTVTVGGLQLVGVAPHIIEHKKLGALVSARATTARSRRPEGRQNARRGSHLHYRRQRSVAPGVLAGGLTAAPRG